MLDCKANAMDVQEQLDQKADDKQAKQIYADKPRFEQALLRLSAAEAVLSDKCDLKSKCGHL